MKRHRMIVLCGIGLVLFIGCANVSYTSSSVETKLDYTRLGMMKLDGFKLVKAVDGTMTVEFNKSESGVGDLAEAILNLTKTVKIP